MTSKPKLTEKTRIVPRIVPCVFSSSGIGFQTAETLVQLGATVYLAARNEEKASTCIKKIEEKVGETAKGRVIYHHIDLASPKGAKESATKFIGQVDRLDILSR